ncbi:serine hydrolase domain-containing protein [Jannaschia sp. R86511]|uniref:serine hydrolase domain-containing protein n=1 Tax=Jannaschia sp. R86511 TaxID=3093853 RepID=UPI0036D39998
MLDDETLQRLDSTFRSWVDRRDLAGTVLLTQRGRTLLEGCYGPADRATGTPVTSRTRFGLASVTKMMTAVATVDLLRRDLLTGLDRPVVDLLPPSRRPSTLRGDVTVHHLLCHTSGIADYCEEDEDHPRYCEDYGALWDDRPSYRMERPDDFLPMFADLPPDRAPGVRYQYCNAGFVLLALVLEELTGQPFADLVQERVLVPAGMTASGFLRLDEAHPDVAVGYLPRRSPQEPWRSNVYRVPVVGGGDGGMLATARDLDRFLTAYDDGTLLGGLRDLLLQPHADTGDAGYRSGYGVHLAPDGRFGHGGGDPGVECAVSRSPEQGVNLVVLCSMEGAFDDMWTSLRQAWVG